MSIHYRRIRELLIPVLANLAFASGICACSTGLPSFDAEGGRAEAPIFLACRTVSATEIAFRFSKPVRVSSLYLDPPGDIGSIEEGEEVFLSLNRPFPGGEQVMADILVVDEKGNTLNVLVPFRARNDNIPPIVINELRTEYSRPRVEFVELKALAAGNIGALRLFIASASMENPFYEFPPVNVKAGDYIVLHLRTLDPDSINETGANLAESPYTKDNEAQPEARDFWIPDAKKYISKKGDAIFLLDQDNRILDALLFCETATPWWQDAALANAAAYLHEEGAWISASGEVPGPVDAVLSRDTTATRTISRDEEKADTNTAADWYITAASNHTPGLKNSDKRFVPKE